MRTSSADLCSMFGWGAVGGTLPTLGKIAGTYGANFDAPLPAVLGVLIALLLYALIGSIVSRAIGNPDMKQALFAGIAAPAIVVSVLAGASDSRSLSRITPNPPFSFLSSAYAQNPTPAPFKGPGRRIVVETNVERSYPVSGLIQVSAIKDNEPIPVGTIDPSGNKPFTSLTIPAGSAELEFASSNGVTAKTPVDPSHFLVRLDIKAKTSTGSDLLWALGANRTLEISSMKAEFRVPDWR